MPLWAGMEPINHGNLQETAGCSTRCREKAGSTQEKQPEGRERPAKGGRKTRLGSDPKSRQEHHPGKGYGEGSDNAG